MHLYKINYIFHPFKTIHYFYNKNKVKSLNIFVKVLQNNFIIFSTPVNCFCFIIQNGFFFFTPRNEPWKVYSEFNLMKSYTQWFYILKKGEYCRYRVSIQIVGLGNRIIEDTWKSVHRLYLKLGHAHLIFFQVAGSMLFKKHKRKATIRIFSTNIFLLSNFIYMIRRFRGPNCYTGNGVKIYKEKLKYKRRKKWGVI